MQRQRWEVNFTLLIIRRRGIIFIKTETNLGGIMRRNLLFKIFSMTLVLTFIFTSAISAVTFTDISGCWAKDYIMRVADNGIVTGYKDGTFRPDDNVTVLESLVMMSRLYDIDKDTAELIVDKREPVLGDMTNSSTYSWAYDELSKAIALGIVSENGVSQMFESKSISNYATKEEVAVLLTKAMGLGDEAKELRVYTLPFTDRDKISSAAKPYIYMMYSKGILQGDDDKNINPKVNITRAVMATMMDRAYKYIQDNKVVPDFSEYVSKTTLKGFITELEKGTIESYITVVNDEEKTGIAKVNGQTAITIGSVEGDFEDLKEGMLVTCEINSDTGAATSIKVDSTVETVRGIISYVAYVSPATITIIDEEGDTVKYDVPDDIIVYLDGTKVALKTLDKEDEIMLIFKNDELNQINASSKIKEYKGKITDINYDDFPIVITVKLEDGSTMEFEYSSDVDITRNDDDSSFDQVMVGDEVTFTTRYDELIRINTVAAEAEISGTIKEILIASPQNKIKISDEDGNVTQYTVSNNVKINIGTAV
jgi:hypothetical protein